MIKVRIPTPLRPMTGGKNEVEISGNSVVIGKLKGARRLRQHFEMAATFSSQSNPTPLPNHWQLEILPTDTTH